MRLHHAAVLALALALTVYARAEDCNPRALGAKADGVTRDTAAIQAAIDACAARSNSAVRFTAGTYLSAPLTLRSNTHLILDKGATLLGSPDMADYPIRADAPWRRVSLLHFDHATNVSITGQGVIDGNGKVWWDAQLKRQKGTPENPRPLLIDITNSKNILIEGVTIQNSPQYNIAVFLSDGLTVRNVTIRNPGRGAPNTDGIDPVSTSHVLIEHTTIDTGDDNVAIKSGLVERGDPDVPSTDITIRDCTFLNGHGLSIARKPLAASATSLSRESSFAARARASASNPPADAATTSATSPTETSPCRTSRRPSKSPPTTRVSPRATMPSLSRSIRRASTTSLSKV